MVVQFFDITRQNNALKDKIEAVVAEVIGKGRFILGENVAALEKEIAAYCNAKYAIGVASGTDAIHLGLRACGVKPGDEVITSPFTFVATADAIEYCGAKPVFADIEPKTFNLDPQDIEAKITPKTKAVMPVHLYGQSCDMQKIKQLCQKNNIFCVEDAAQAIGAESDGQKIGAIGDAAGISFFPTKNLGCFGDGGMVVTNQDKIADEVRVLRGHGSRKTYHYDLIGYNSRLDELQAAILLVKLGKLDDYAAARRKNAEIYRESLKDLEELILPFEAPGTKHVYNQFTIRVKDRDDLFEHLKSKGVGCMVYYPLSLHLQNAFAYLGYKKGDLPQSEAAQAEVLSLPIYAELKESEIEETCRAIKEFYKR